MLHKLEDLHLIPEAAMGVHVECWLAWRNKRDRENRLPKVQAYLCLQICTHSTHACLHTHAHAYMRIHTHTIEHACEHTF